MGSDGISSEILKSIPWRPLLKIRKAFDMRYLEALTASYRTGGSVTQGYGQ